MKKSVYLGSLQFLIPEEYLGLRILAFLGCLGFEMYMIATVCLSCVLYAFVFMILFQSSIFWTRESR
jgi:hypothetical protein